MDFSQLLLEFLMKNGSVSVAGFGEFYLKKTNAFVDKDTQNILPPASEVAFRNEGNKKGTDFIHYLSAQKNISEIEAEIEVKKQVNFWNSKLEKEGQLILENLGTFLMEESKITFKRKRTFNLSPDFYGLEEINISEIKNNSTLNKKETTQKSYTFPKSIYWLLPLVIGVLALTYFGITQPEEIFGKKSFTDDLKEKLPVQLKKDSQKTDSLQKDSASINIKLDSLQKDSIPSALSPKTPVKQWSSKNSSNSQWKKAKKRRNP